MCSLCAVTEWEGGEEGGNIFGKVYAVAEWKVAGSRPDEVIEMYRFRRDDQI
jgi:hypothetical protein